MQPELDCQACGACCVNPRTNREEGTSDYVEVGPGDDILKRPDLVRRHVVTNSAGEMHLAMNPDGRCKALSGKLGCKVRCTIYHHRPRPCRRVEPGTPLCLWYRQMGTGIA